MRSALASGRPLRSMVATLRGAQELSDPNTMDRAIGGLGGTMVRAGRRLKAARKDFGHAHEPRQRLLFAIVASLAAVGVVALLMVRWGDAGALDYVELPSRDLRVTALEDNAARDPDVLLINVDEAALAYGDWYLESEEGEAAEDRYAWPWPRHVYNKIIRYCREGGAHVIVFDMVFSETGPNTNQPVIVREQNGRPTRFFTFDKAGDDLFAMEAGARDDVAMALALGTTKRERDARAELMRPYGVDVAGAGRDDWAGRNGGRFARFRSADAPYPALLHGWPSIVGQPGEDERDRALRMYESLRSRINEDAHMRDSPRHRSLLPMTASDEPDGIAGLGMVMGFPDADGKLRRYDFAGAHEGETFRALPVEAWRLYVLSHAREAADDRSRREAFRERFPDMRIDDDGLHLDGKVYTLGDELRDVPVIVDGDTARYLGRDIPLDATGRAELRYRGFLPVEEHVNWPHLDDAERQAMRARNPDGLFAVYPQVSARQILSDWDVISEQRFKQAETARLEARIAELEEGDERAQAQAELDRVRRMATTSPALGPPGDVVKDKVVFIAGTATGLKDAHATPLSDATPGTWVIATFFDNLKNEDFMTTPPRWTDWLAAVLATVLAVFAVMYARRLRKGLMVVVGLGLATLVASWLAFEFQVWMATAAPLAGLLFGFSNGALAKALSEGRQRRQREAFARQYMGEELVDYVIKHPGSLKLGGENRQMTIYFSDVAGFTTVTETLGADNPERLVELLNVYLERMTDRMLESGAVIDKYMGDAIMCFWGAPMTMEDHAVRACRGALACRAELHRMQPLFADAVRGIAPQLIKPGGSVLHARAGINTGVVTVGNMGSSKRFAYTVMGDAVNLAARLEPQNKQYGTDLMIGQETEKMIRGEFTTRPLDLIVVKGKSEPVEIYELLGERDVPQFIQDLLKHWNEAIGLFRDRQFAEALKAFRNAEHHEAAQDNGALNPSRLYIKRCEDLIAEPPPPDWNGVYVKTSK